MAPSEETTSEHAHGSDFIGSNNIRHDLYPAIDVSRSANLQQPGKVVLITGAGRGLGRAMSIQYAHANVSVIIICARTASELDEVEQRIKEVNDKIVVQQERLNVTDSQAVKDLAQRVAQKHGRLDILINNAGLMHVLGPFASIDLDMLWRVQEVNVKGPILLLHTFLPLLIKTADTHTTHTNVINISSFGAVAIVPGSSGYGISKIALQRLSEYVAAECSDKRVNVLGLHPGGVKTKMAENAPDIQDLLVDTPELCGGVAVWLTSANRDWLNGRYVSSTWDVEALERKREDIVKGDMLKLQLTI